MVSLALGMLILEACCYWYAIAIQQLGSLTAKLDDQRQRQILFLTIRQDLVGSEFQKPLLIELGQTVMALKHQDQSIRYWIKPSKTDSTHAWALYRRVGGNKSVELLRGIWNIRTEYDYWDESTQRIELALASHIQDWSTVVGIRMTLYLESDFKIRNTPLNPSLQTLCWTRRA